MNMKQQRSPDKPDSNGYTRICADCGGDMNWRWGGPITYFQCGKCERIKPCANIVIDRSQNTVTIENGNKKEVFAYRPEDFNKVIELVVTKETS